MSESPQHLQLQLIGSGGQELHGPAEPQPALCARRAVTVRLEVDLPPPGEKELRALRPRPKRVLRVRIQPRSPGGEDVDPGAADQAHQRNVVLCSTARAPAGVSEEEGRPLIERWSIARPMRLETTPADRPAGHALYAVGCGQQVTFGELAEQAAKRPSGRGRNVCTSQLGLGKRLPPVMG
jgi:hypothetical protein